MRPSHVTAYPAAGEIIDGKYQILQMLGEGGMGAVAKAHHMLRRAPVALKFMAPHVLTIPGAVERFLNEAVAASQIENQHVVTIYDVGKLPTGAPYLVMEYLDGRDLAHLIDAEGQRGIDVPRAVHFVLQILRALQVAHAAGIVHRDLKPSNAFIIKKDGESDFVKLVDFGISKVTQPGAASLTQTNSALGTPLYMSPEQAKSPRDVDLRSDLYSVGCLFYELLTGRTPHSSDSGELTEILFKLFTQDPTHISELRRDLPQGLADVVHKGLARERDLRYATAAEFGEALGPYADERSAHVLARLRAPVERRSEPPPVHGSMPAPMASLQQAFSQLNSAQFPQPPMGSQMPMGPATPSGMASGHYNTPGQTPSGAPARTQALPPGAHTPHAGIQVAAAGTQSSQTGMGVVSDSDKKIAKTPIMAFIPPVIVVALIGSGIWWLTHRAPPTAAKADLGPTVSVTAPIAPPIASAVPVVAPPSATPSASAAPSASAPVQRAPNTPVKATETPGEGTKLPTMGVKKTFDK